MRVILREDLDNLGRAGEVVSVRDGYARNFLLPRGMASLATEKDIKRLEHEKRVISARNAKLQAALKVEVEKMSSVSVEIARAVGEGDKLYGSVTNRDIAEALAGKGVQLDAKKIQLDEPLKTLGMHEVPVRLGRNAVANIKVWVVKKE